MLAQLLKDDNVYLQSLKTNVTTLEFISQVPIFAVMQVGLLTAEAKSVLAVVHGYQRVVLIPL